MWSIIVSRHILEWSVMYVHACGCIYRVYGCIMFTVSVSCDVELSARESHMMPILTALFLGCRLGRLVRSASSSLTRSRLHTTPTVTEMTSDVRGAGWKKPEGTDSPKLRLYNSLTKQKVGLCRVSLCEAIVVLHTISYRVFLN